MKRNLLSVALATATLMIATAAQAQDASATADRQAPPEETAALADDATELDRVTVTGIRRGIEDAIEAKRTSTSIVESVSAEDIGKLPDMSIADSLARLPGLTAQRFGNRPQEINIRGFAGDFSTTLLNGREQVSLGNNRGVEFDQYPSELVSAVVVYKTPDASLIGQGLSGTVDLRTVRPLSFSERVMSFNVRGEKNSLGKLNPESDDTGYRVSGSYIDQFMDGRLGLAIGYARLDAPGQANRWESWGYPTTADGDRVLGGFKSQVSSVDNVRDGLMATVEFKPNDFYHGILDLYYSTFDKEETLRFMETGLAWSSATLSNAVVENGAVVSGTFTGVRPVLRNDRNTQDDTIFAAGWRNEFEFSEDWSALADVSFSKAEREESLLETYSGLGHASNPDAFDSVDFVIGSDGLPQFSYGEDYTDPSNIVLTDPGGWGQDGFLKVPRVEDKLSSLRLSAERSFESGIFSSFEFGVNYADREKTRESGLEAFLRLRDGREVPIPTGALMDPADLDFTGIPGSIGYDIDAIMGLYNVDPLIHQDVTNKNWTVEEKLTTAYVQWNINADLGSIPLRGNVGFQMVRADQSSSGFQVPFSEADNPTPMSGGAEYTDFLPSLNLAFSLPHDQTLRVGLGEQMARPRMDQMRANNNIGIDETRVNANGDPGMWTANGGNPELKPWRATAFDLSYEKYFGGRGYFSLAGFHKDLHTWIRETTVPFDFGNPDCGTRPVCPSTSLGEFTRPENVDGGILYGFEGAVSVPFDLLWAPLEGFGIQASYSTTHSRVTPDPEGPAIDLPGLSKEVSNVTLYYERYGFSTRVSRRHRSPFLGEVTGFGNDRQDRYINHEDIVDLQIGYAFPETSALNGLSVLFQVNNITNEPYREYFPDFTGLPRMFNEYGRTALLGVTYKF